MIVGISLGGLTGLGQDMPLFDGRAAPQGRFEKSELPANR